MKKLIFMTGLLCAVFLKGNAQELKIGDKVPDFILGKIINHPTESLKFSEIKSRLIILDYWSISCTPCVTGLPKMDSLQKKFGNSILILPVTILDENPIRSFWSRNKYTNSTSLPTVVNDTLRTKWFPNSGTGVPFEVWILDGKIFALTGSEQVNEKEISDVLANRNKHWANRIKPRYDIQKPLVSPTAFLGKTPERLFYSVITSAKQAAGNFVTNLNDTARKFTRGCFINFPISRLYVNAYASMQSDMEKLNIDWLNYANRNIFEVKNLNKYRHSREHQMRNSYYYDDWLLENTFCYEAVLPANFSRKQFGYYMIADLNKFFNLYGRIEKRNTECWILTMKQGVTKVKDKLSQSYLKIKEEKAQNAKPKNIDQAANQTIAKFNKIWADVKIEDEELEFNSVEDILGTINIRSGSKIPPLIDESGYKGSFNISMKLPLSEKKDMDFKSLQKELNEHGFDLKKGVRELDMFVLTENDFKPSNK